MLCVIKQPGQDPEITEIDNTLRALQQAVGGYIETVRMGRSVIAIVNEEGRLIGLLPNVLGLVGPIVFLGDDGEEFRGLTEDEASWLMRLL
ncbi:MAG: DUF3846 domain-containing protein [Oscillospiraceae bacterium]|nr:DUF3846 domain-containing protein [Oscillospiraceae bacterium]